MKVFLLKLVSVIVEFLWEIAVKYLMNKSIDNILLNIIKNRLLVKLPELYGLIKEKIASNPEITNDQLLEFVYQQCKEAGVDLFKFASPEIYKEILKKLKI